MPDASTDVQIKTSLAPGKPVFNVVWRTDGPDKSIVYKKTTRRDSWFATAIKTQWTPEHA